MRDDAEATRAAIERALDGADVLLLTGGVSVGPHDHVKPALAALGVEEVFWRVALRPGKPLWFGRRGAQLVFGLPGNPVSAMVCFMLFARPALRAMQGAPAAPPRRRAVLGAPVAAAAGARRGGARAARRRPRAADRPAGLAPAALDARRRRARDRPARRGRGCRPAPRSRSSRSERLPAAVSAGIDDTPRALVPALDDEVVGRIAEADDDELRDVEPEAVRVRARPR